MSALRINLLGIVQVAFEGIENNSGLGRSVKGLLGYLTLFRHRFHAREVLAGVFWGESSESRARSNLSTTLWRLRKILEPGTIPTGTYLITTSMGEIGFNQESDHWIDAQFLENTVKPVLAKPYNSLNGKEVNQLAGALNLYKGDLLEGFYDDWALRERERLRALFVKGQIHLLHYYTHHAAWEKGLTCAQKILNLDPLREEIHREMMRLYFKNGQRALALKQFEKCRNTLALELDIPPMEETQLLYAQISQRTGGDIPSLDPQIDIITAQKVLAQLKRNIHDFEKSMEILRHSARNLESAILNSEVGMRPATSLVESKLEKA